MKSRYCVVCNAAAAVLCVDCNSLLCPQCDNLLHFSSTRGNHSRTVLLESSSHETNATARPASSLESTRPSSSSKRELDNHLDTNYTLSTRTTPAPVVVATAVAEEATGSNNTSSRNTVSDSIYDPQQTRAVLASATLVLQSSSDRLRAISPVLSQQSQVGRLSSKQIARDNEQERNSDQVYIPLASPIVPNDFRAQSFRASIISSNDNSNLESSGNGNSSSSFRSSADSIHSNSVSEVAAVALARSRLVLNDVLRQQQQQQILCQQQSSTTSSSHHHHDHDVHNNINNDKRINSDLPPSSLTPSSSSTEPPPASPAIIASPLFHEQRRTHINSLLARAGLPLLEERDPVTGTKRSEFSTASTPPPPSPPPPPATTVSVPVFHPPPPPALFQPSSSSLPHRDEEASTTSKIQHVRKIPEVVIPLASTSSFTTSIVYDSAPRFVDKDGFYEHTTNMEVEERWVEFPDDIPPPPPRSGRTVVIGTVQPLPSPRGTMSSPVSSSSGTGRSERPVASSINSHVGADGEHAQLLSGPLPRGISVIPQVQQQRFESGRIVDVSSSSSSHGIVSSRYLAPMTLSAPSIPSPPRSSPVGRIVSSSSYISSDVRSVVVLPSLSSSSISQLQTVATQTSPDDFGDSIQLSPSSEKSNNTEHQRATPRKSTSSSVLGNEKDDSLSIGRRLSVGTNGGATNSRSHSDGTEGIEVQQREDNSITTSKNDNAQQYRGLALLLADRKTQEAAMLVDQLKRQASPLPPPPPSRDSGESSSRFHERRRFRNDDSSSRRTYEYYEDDDEDESDLDSTSRDGASSSVPSIARGMAWVADALQADSSSDASSVFLQVGGRFTVNVPPPPSMSPVRPVASITSPPPPPPPVVFIQQSGNNANGNGSSTYPQQVTEPQLQPLASLPSPPPPIQDNGAVFSPPPPPPPLPAAGETSGTTTTTTTTTLHSSSIVVQPSYSPVVANTSSTTQQTVQVHSRTEDIARRASVAAPEASPEEEVILRQMTGRAKKGTPVLPEHSMFSFTAMMIEGIKIVVSRCDQKVRDLGMANDVAPNLSADDFLSVTTDINESGTSGEFRFKDYAPKVFHFLRRQFGVDSASYLQSTCGSEPLTQLGTPGKSGQIFYFTPDGRYMVKTVSKAEAKLLRKILPQYYQHCCKYKNTLLCRFFGLHRLKPSNAHIVVMGNIFDTDRVIHERFDLKGSTQGREVSPTQRSDLSAILKDNDFLRMGRKIHLGSRRRKLLLEQLQRDADLLAGLKIMDYSLLLGIHFRDRPRPRDSNPKSPAARIDRRNRRRSLAFASETTYTSIFQYDAGGLASLAADGTETGNEIYFMAVIDILQKYNVRKQLETTVKGVRYSKDSISSVHPDFYAKRFVGFIKQLTD